MKNILSCLLVLFTCQSFAQNKSLIMQNSFIKTKIGAIAVFIKNENSNATPIIFLHGVYFDHHLWDNQIAAINDRTVIAIDMPWHGESKKAVPNKWTLDECANMLIEILDSLQIEKVITIGHSWGSMTILRAAHKQPNKFISVGFCNMPFEAIASKKKISFKLQHTALLFRKFYIKQAAQSLFGRQSLKDNPTLHKNLFASMTKLSARQIRLTDRFVILNAKNTSSLIESLSIPALALKGKDDYVPTPPVIETIIVKGGHISPLEAVGGVTDFCMKVIAKANNKQ
jgi:3-oxoadipate enol-lactonase